MKKAVSAAIIVIMLMLLCGCSNSNDLVLDVSEFNEEETTPVKGGTINLFCDVPDTLNPLVTGYKSVSEVMYLVYDSMFVTENNFSATPLLASGYVAEETNTRYIVKLRKKVQFHDGTDFDANDVISTVEKIFTSDSRYKSSLNNLKSFYATDSHTVVFELAQSQTNFENLLDFPILPSECSDQDYIQENKYFVPCGTGKFKIESMGTNSLILVKNENNRLGEEPYVDNIKISYVQDSSIAKFTFEAMETDVITTDLYTWGDTAMKGEFSTYEYESNRLAFIGINCANTSLSDKNVRKAISDAIDKERLVSDVMYTHGAVVNSPVNPNAFFSGGGYVTDRYELGEALQKLKNAGWLDLDNDGVLDKYFNDAQHSLFFNLVVDSENSGSVRLANLIAENMEQEGIRINVVPLTYWSYVAAVQNGEYDLFVGRIDIADDCDVSFLLKSGGAQNYFRYSSPLLDEAFYKISTADGESSIKNAYKAFDSVFKDELPMIPLYFENDAVFSSIRIKGELAVSRTGIYTGFENVYVKYK